MRARLNGKIESLKNIVRDKRLIGKKAMAKLQLRPATVGDAERLLEIYAPYVKKTAITFEDEVPSIGEFQARIKQTLKTYPYLVALQSCE